MDYDSWCQLSVDDRLFRMVDGLFSGLAIPCDKSTVDGGTIRSEKVLKFNRKALRRIKIKEDKERKEREHKNRLDKLMAFYHNEDNILNERSPFEEV